MNKLDVQNAILNAMTPYLDDDQLYQLKNTLIEQLYGMNIVEEETRLSVGKRTKICVKKNENLCQKFCAATNTLLDYGCGKGRVDFFLSYQTRCHTIGVEYNERIYEKAVENREQGAAAGRTEFVLADAVQFSVPAEVDRIYFFNPFSIEILKKVLARVLESYYENPRELLLFFYYPSDEYISYLMTVDELIFSDEIDCRDLFPGENKRERIVVFEVE